MAHSEVRARRHRNITWIAYALGAAYVAIGVWFYVSGLEPSRKVQIMLALWVLSPLAALLHRAIIGSLGAKRLLKEDWLDSLVNARFPRAEEHHNHVDSFLSDIQHSESVSVNARLIAARWEGQLSVKRAQFVFFNVEVEALDLAFEDYRRLRIGTDNALAMNEH